MKKKGDRRAETFLIWMQKEDDHHDYINTAPSEREDLRSWNPITSSVGVGKISVKARGTLISVHS